MLKKLFVCIVSVLCLTACSSEIEKRKNALSDTAIMETVLPMIQTHYDGILEEDYNKCFGVYAPFYQSAVNDEWAYYNFSSQEAYISGSDVKLRETFGDDVSITVNVTDTQRCELKEISDYKKNINSVFASGTPHITDAIEISTEITYSGNISETSEQTTWYAFLINEKWYLYDSYYEDISEKFIEEQKNTTEKPQTNIVVVE